MIRGIFNFLCVAGFTLLLPFFCAAAYWFGSEDEKFLMKAAFCALGPICLDLWYILISHIFVPKLRWPSLFDSFFQFLLLVGGYAMIVFLLKERIISF